MARTYLQREDGVALVALVALVAFAAIAAGCAAQRAPMAPPTPGGSVPIAASPSATGTATVAAPTRNDDLPPLPPPDSPVTADPCVDRIGDCARYRVEQTESTNASAPFDRERAIDAVSRVQLSDCRRFDGSGNGTAEVYFLPNGAVVYVRLDENVRDTLTGDCIERRLRRVKIAPFFGRSQSVRRFFTLD